jgi:hypothetical protein
MLLHWHLAQRDLAQGGNPGLNLRKALEDQGHTNDLLHRDYLGDILNFKAGIERSQGRDPRPTLAQALDRMQPLLRPGSSWTVCETLAETWLIRADWEAAHGLDARSSLQHCQDLADRALGINPRSGPAHALKGLAEMVGITTLNSDRGLLRRQAQAQLRLATALMPTGRLQQQLQRSLAGE